MLSSRRKEASQSAGSGQGEEAGANGPLKFTSNQSNRACCKVVDSAHEQRMRTRNRIGENKKGDDPENPHMMAHHGPWHCGFNDLCFCLVLKQT